MLSDTYFQAETDNVLRHPPEQSLDMAIRVALKKMYIQGRNSVVGACMEDGNIELARQIKAILNQNGTPKPA